VKSEFLLLAILNVTDYYYYYYYLYSPPKRDEITRGCKRMHNEEIHNVCCSQDIVMIKSLRVRSAGHVASTGEKRNA
jgi:hypothetical protein